MMMRTFDLETIKPYSIYRVYKEENNLIIVTIHNRKTIFENLNAEEMDILIEQLKNKCLKKRCNLEVYNDRYEAENH